MASILSEKRLGKMRARDEGSGGAGGVVLSMTLMDGGLAKSAYAIPVQIGDSTFPLEVDIGSSDCWITSTSCQTSPCNAVKTRYNPSSSQPTNQNFSLSYLQGNVSGPIVRDTFSLGGYTISRLPFAAASSIYAEPLGSNFAGLLGLALPGNSIITAELKTTGQTFPEGLFSSSGAPAAQFISLALERPGYSAIPSVLGIGRHPSALIPNPSKVRYMALAGGANSNFWNAPVSQVTVYTNKTALPITLAGSVGNFNSPTAALDSGVPVILTTRQIANALYGAIGVGPGADGNYYFPCNKPLNISFTVGGLEVPLHPLDTSAPTQDKGMCQGTVVANDAAFQNDHAIGDFVLGVPFMRNVYTVLAYTPPDASGAFAPPKGGFNIQPRLGLLPLTDPAAAAEEWRQVHGHSTPASIGTPAIVGIAVGGLFALCALIVLGRCLFVRRRSPDAPPPGSADWEAEKGMADFARLHRESSNGGYALATLNGDTLRASPRSVGASPLGKNGADYFSRRSASMSGAAATSAEARASEFGERPLLGLESHDQQTAGTDRTAYSAHERRPSKTPLLEGTPKFSNRLELEG